MNLFEGSRRIAKIIGGVIIAGSLFALFQQKPYIVLNYKSLPFGDFVESTSDECRIGIDGIQRETYLTDKGNSFQIAYCFVAMKADNGATLVPYKLEGKSLLLDEPYSQGVQQHMREFVAKRRPSTKDFAKVDGEYGSEMTQLWLKGVGALLGGLLFYWLIVWSIGWVMRGFMGIPRGQDYRISPAQPS